MIEAYKKALTLDPTYAELAVKLAYELSRRNDPSSGVQILKDTIKAAPKEAVPYIYLSQIYAKDLNKPDLGLKYAEQALALAPDNFAAYLAVYEIYMATGQSKKAEQLLDRAAKSEHGDAKYWAQLGDLCTRLYLKRGRFQRTGAVAEDERHLPQGGGLGKRRRDHSDQGRRLFRAVEAGEGRHSLLSQCPRPGARPERCAAQ
ncbi:MAG: tetratricopeptide repeat protein [Chthoniobacter sp.]